jgi:hypothetical protein
LCWVQEFSSEGNSLASNVTNGVTSIDILLFSF